MSRDDAFLQAILDDPDDDTPRLVFADWLDESGRPERAEFIRVQIELYRLPEDDPRRRPLEERERLLLHGRGAEWLGDLKRWLSMTEFRRGFVERAQIGARQFLTHAGRVFRLAPLRHLKLLRLPQMKSGPAEVAACPELQRLRGLDLDNSYLGDARLAVVLGSPYLRNLTELHLRNSGAGARAVRLLASGAFERLRALELADNNLHRHLQTLLTISPPVRLEELDLSDCGLDSGDAAALAGWPGLATVTRLRLRNNGLRVTGIQSLAASPHLANLAHLDLGNSGVGVTGTRALAGANGLAGLRSLGLSSNGLGINGLRSLLESPHLSGVTRLNLGANGLGDAGMSLLAGWPGLTRLRSLSLYNNAITDRGVAALATSPFAADLTEFDLTTNLIGDTGARALAESSVLGRLARLSLGWNHVRDGGAKALAESPHLPALKHLDLYGIDLRPATRKLLAARFTVGA